MRYVEVTMQAVDEWHPFHRKIRTSTGISPELIHRVSQLEDGTVLELYEVSGDVERVREVIEPMETVNDYELSTRDGRVLVYAQLEPSPVIDELLDIRERYRTVVEMPLELRDDGSIRATVIGDETEMWDSFSAMPEHIEINIERVGSYYPGTERLYDELTERQKEILETAVSIGYYEVPREKTHADIAEHFDCSAATVGEHLRKIEGRLIPKLVPGTEEPPAGLEAQLRE